MRFLCGDASRLDIPDGTVQCCITSPPYFGLRDYGTARWEGGDPQCDHKGKPKQTQAGFNERYFGKASVASDKQAELTEVYKGVCGKCGAVRVDEQVGLEDSPKQYVENIVKIFRETWRVLRDDGTLWLNIGDSYAGSMKGTYSGGIAGGEIQQGNRGTLMGELKPMKPTDGLKPKDLIGIPWMVAFAMRDDGWYLRQDIIWHKLNPMPESVRDRPTRSHEYVFLLTKSQRYYYNYEESLELATGFDGRKDTRHKGSTKYEEGAMPDGQPNTMARNGHERWKWRPSLQTGMTGEPHSGYTNPDGSLRVGMMDGVPVRNPRDVWALPTQPYKGAHFATMPMRLVEKCMKAGTKEGDIVLDPFGGSGTVGVVASQLGRDFILNDLNPEYVEMQKDRIRKEGLCQTS